MARCEGQWSSVTGGSIDPPSSQRDMRAGIGGYEREARDGGEWAKGKGPGAENGVEGLVVRWADERAMTGINEV